MPITAAVIVAVPPRMLVTESGCCVMTGLIDVSGLVLVVAVPFALLTTSE